MTKLAAPAHLAFLADSAQVNTFEAPASPKNPMFEEWYYIDNETDQPTHGQFRHQQRANVVFVDGHLGLEQMVPGSLDQRLPAQRIGWLPAVNPATPGQDTLPYMARRQGEAGCITDTNLRLGDCGWCRWALRFASRPASIVWLRAEIKAGKDKKK